MAYLHGLLIAGFLTLGSVGGDIVVSVWSRSSPRLLTAGFFGLIVGVSVAGFLLGRILLRLEGDHH